jgi:Flp pilus assembly protein TadB
VPEVPKASPLQRLVVLLFPLLEAMPCCHLLLHILLLLLLLVMMMILLLLLVMLKAQKQQQQQQQQLPSAAAIAAQHSQVPKPELWCLVAAGCMVQAH